MQIHKYKPIEIEYIYAKVLLPPIKRTGTKARGKFAIIRVPMNWVGKWVKIVIKSSKPSLNSSSKKDCLKMLDKQDKLIKRGKKNLDELNKMM